MKSYKLTVFEKDGEKILEETFQADDDATAKELGSKMLEDQKFQDKTHRCTSPEGKLLLFHS